VIDETRIIEAARAGRLLGCSVNGQPGTVDAVLLRSLCREHRHEVDDRGIRLRNASIPDPLDLAGVTVPFPIHLESSRLENPLDLTGANLQELILHDCQLPGLLGNGVEVRRDLNISRPVITGSHTTTASESRAAAVWLCESHIGGRLLCVDTTIHPTRGERAMQADRMKVGGNVRLIHNFVAHGEVRMIGAMIDGSLDLTGAQFGDGTGLALDLADAVVGGSLYLIADRAGRRANVRGRIDMGSARIAGHFIIRDATITAGTVPPSGSYYSQSVHGTAIHAPRLTVGSTFLLEGESTINGRMALKARGARTTDRRDGVPLRCARQRRDRPHQCRDTIWAGTGPRRCRGGNRTSVRCRDSRQPDDA
jgi:hypothetical protein